MTKVEEKALIKARFDAIAPKPEVAAECEEMKARMEHPKATHSHLYDLGRAEVLLFTNNNVCRPKRSASRRVKWNRRLRLIGVCPHPHLCGRSRCKLSWVHFSLAIRF